MSGLRTFLGDRSGAAAAEMALMLPLLVTLLFVTFEGGYFLWNEHKVVKAVRAGARYAARLNFSNYDCANGAVDAAAEANIQNLTRTGGLDASAAPVIANWSSEGVVVEVACDDDTWDGIYAGTAGVAPLVTVRGVAPYPSTPLTGLAAVFGFDATSLTLRAEAESSVAGV